MFKIKNRRENLDCLKREILSFRTEEPFFLFLSKHLTKRYASTPHLNHANQYLTQAARAVETLIQLQIALLA